MSADEDAPGELAHCRWCRWHGWRPLGFYETVRRCLHPRQVFRMPPSHSSNRYFGRCRDWNRIGDCKRYRPTLLTRLLRLFGVRLPAVNAKSLPSPTKFINIRPRDEVPDLPGCHRCRWGGPELEEGRWCIHPLQVNESPERSSWMMGLCDEWNYAFQCTRYEPNRRTRRQERNP